MQKHPTTPPGGSPAGPPPGGSTPPVGGQTTPTSAFIGANQDTTPIGGWQGFNGDGTPTANYLAAHPDYQAQMDERAKNLKLAAQLNDGTPNALSNYEPTWQEMGAQRASYDRDGKGYMDPRNLGLLAKFGGDQAAMNRWINKYSYNPQSFKGWSDANPHMAFGGSYYGDEVKYTNSGVNGAPPPAAPPPPAGAPPPAGGPKPYTPPVAGPAPTPYTPPGVGGQPAGPPVGTTPVGTAVNVNKAYGLSTDLNKFTGGSAVFNEMTNPASSSKNTYRYNTNPNYFNRA